MQSIARACPSKANGTSRLHEFVDIGVPGTVSTRRAACHMRLKMLGRQPARVRQHRVHRPADRAHYHMRARHEPLAHHTLAALARHNGLERAARAVVNSNVCVDTHNAEPTVPWVVGKVMSAEHRAAADSLVFEEGCYTIRFDSFRAGDLVLVVPLGGTRAWLVDVHPLGYRRASGSSACACAEREAG